MTPEEMREICLSFPGAAEGRSYGAPAFLVNKKFFTRLRRDDASVVLMEVGFDEREMLMEAEPETFHFTAHYKDYPCVLARIATLHPGSFVVNHGVEVLQDLLHLRFGRRLRRLRGLNGGVGHGQPGDHRAATHQHHFLARRERFQRLGDARRQVVEIDLRHGRAILAAGAGA